MFTLLVNNKKISDYGLAIKSIHRPLLPSRSFSEIEVQGRDGGLIETSGYKNRIISVLVYFPEKDIQTIREKAREIAYLVSKKSKLIFTDEPDKYYFGMIVDESGLEILGSTGEATLTFVCEPFAYGLNKQKKTLSNGHNRNLNYQGTAETPTRIIIRNTGTETIRNIKITQIRKGD